MLKTILAQESAEAARERWTSVADALRERFPRLVELMDRSREEVLVNMGLSREQWPQVASTNPLEWLNGEIKRREDVAGIFPKNRAVIRLVGALMLEQNDEWR
jgi:transposase-like protein